MTAELTPITGAATLVVGTNTYVTAAEAEAYFAGRINVTAWTGATADDKVRALITACRALDSLPLKYRKTVSSQTLVFPRQIAPHPYPEEWQYLYASYDPTVVPQEVKDSQCEEAWALLKYGSSERANLQAQGVTSVTLGKLTETYAPSNQHGLLSPDAHRMMLPWIAGAVRIARPR